MPKHPHPPTPSPIKGEGEQSPSPGVGEELGVRGKDAYPRLTIPTTLRRKMVEIARQFRKEPTQSEAILWQGLRGKKLDGVKFRRQQPIGPFVVDFYAPSLRLVIEVDGLIHETQKEADRTRQDILEELGLNVLRLPADLVEKNLGESLSRINTKIAELSAQISLSPGGRGVRGEGEK